MKFTADEVKKAIENNKHYWYSLGYEETDLFINGTTVTTKPVETMGGEGEGEHAHIVFKLGNQYFRKDGYYASHYGFEWDGDFTEVKPTQKTITVYETF